MMKCPRCHEGEFFPNRNPYDLKNMMKINERCSVCGQNYEPEPNFYYGSMYVSYGYTVGLFMLVGFVGHFVFGWGLWTIVSALAIVLVALGPYLFRLSRITWLNVFIKFKGKN